MDLFKRMKKKPKDDDDLIIMDEMKEPFSFEQFVDDQIVGRWNKLRKFLDEKGILFFLLSPFQYRNRIITKLVIIGIGVLLGVGPRMFTILEETKTRNAESEMTAILGQQYFTGDIQVTPMESSHYQKQHVLVFDIVGDTAKGVPSSTDKYDVLLTPARGVSDQGNVKYAYSIQPISSNNRLLIVYVDNRKQADETGIYNVTVNIKGQEPMIKPMEVVLSNTQATTTLFDNDGIDLSLLSGKLDTEGDEAIENAIEALDDALNIYEINEDRLASSNIQLDMTTEKLRAFVKEFTYLPDVSDTTTTRDVAKMKDTTKVTIPQIVPKLMYEGKTYDKSTQNMGVSDNDSSDSGYVDTTAETELADLVQVTQQVTSKLMTLNVTRTNKFERLMRISTMLNKPIDIEQMQAGKQM